MSLPSKVEDRSQGAIDSRPTICYNGIGSDPQPDWAVGLTGAQAPFLFLAASPVSQKVESHMSVNPTLYCPIRGQLQVKAKSKDGLNFSEEKRRIDCIKYLLDRDYPISRFKIETTLINFGHGGRNSFRTDVVVFDTPVNEVDRLPLGKQREHIVLIAEIKRDSKKAALAKETQVKAALGFLPDIQAIALYWDDVEQRIFYRKLKGTRQQLLEAPLTYLPDFGHRIQLEKLRYEDLKVPEDLLGIFKRIEDDLHTYISDVSIRYELLLQLLLIKIYDEGANRYNNGITFLQDYTLFDISDSEVLKLFNDALNKSLSIHQRYLPKGVQKKFGVKGSALKAVSKYLAPINLLESSPEKIQSFYMYFAKQLYKWDLAQYFTPYEVVDFIVRLSNPHYGDTIKDPACGSADFLISAYRRAIEFDPKIGDKVYGSDNSINAVQISVLNMLINGDGKSNIVHEDSLANVKKYENQFSILLCNPPFGVRITEKREKVLGKFDLGRNVAAQQTGILFAELCVRQTQPGGRAAIIVPNGYLGNRSANYKAFRDWILRHTKIACIIGFPRFTFKKSGADVSASVLVLEKRELPLQHPEDTEEYPVYVNLLERVGWDNRNKMAKKVYKQDPLNGALVLDSDNEPILDADFEAVLSDLYSSTAIHAFPWMAAGIPNASVNDGWTVSIKKITHNQDYLFDPKRLCRKYWETVATVKKRPHTTLLDICDIVPAGWDGKKDEVIYKYVQLGDVHDNTYEYEEMRGWQLPSRAQHLARQGDIFIGSIWGSVGKWLIAGPDAKDFRLIITNGFHRLRVKPDMQKWLPDLIFALSSEFYRVQMRGLATGSDGLAEVSEIDLGLVLIPKLDDLNTRQMITDYVERFVEGTGSIKLAVSQTIGEKFNDLEIAPRIAHSSQV